MSDSATERRRFQRIAFDAATEISQGERRWIAELCDISLKGLLIRRPHDWNGDPDHPFFATLTLDDETHLHMEVLLTRTRDDLLGFVIQGECGNEGMIGIAVPVAGPANQQALE